LGVRLYSSLKPLLSKIKPITLETRLWSDRLQVNGRSDCIGYYDGKLSVIDFKSSLREKNEQWIEDYFIQATLYAMMILELTSIPIQQVVILIAVEQGFPQLFRRETKEFLPKAIHRARGYHSMIS
jgi:hypothetical protein